MKRTALFLILAMQLVPSSSYAFSTAAIQSADTVPTLRWRLIARQLNRADAAARAAAQKSTRASNGPALGNLPAVMMQGRINAVLAAAQYAATDSALADPARPPRRVALAAASLTVLNRFWPAAQADCERELQRDIEAARSAGATQQQIEAAERIGRAVATAVMDWAKTDGSDAQWKSSIPEGPGMWRNAPGAQPGGVASILRKPWVLESIDQFRLPPPPAIDSPEFEAALDEVRRVARERTSEQTRLAKKWVEGGPPWWVDTTTDVLLKYQLPDDVVLRMLTILAVGSYDLQSACWETKYHYWVLRPTHADSTITIPEGMSLPNFPAYPSGHACFAGFASTLIGHFIPAARDDLDRIAEENALSRLYAGVHYRFDNDAGLEMGRTVARYLIEQEEKGGFHGRWRK
jgi:hypothetical protein